ncbi:hypothetical protein ABT324_29430 [Saccharopolyspora sp. NPDC000359]|uniref:hypothetical protein n=1 Tax=Saccharopolyspora sp. NPDC000359 TaxID=3154251 RepID=UPI00331917C0
MFWIQLSTFVLVNVLILALIATQIPFGSLRFAAGQHAGAVDGEYTVWHLIADIEAERSAAAPAQPRYREHPPITLEPPAPPEPVQSPQPVQLSQSPQPLTPPPSPPPPPPPQPEFPDHDPDDQPTGRHHLRR